LKYQTDQGFLKADSNNTVVKKYLFKNLDRTSGSDNNDNAFESSIGPYSRN